MGGLDLFVSSKRQELLECEDASKVIMGMEEDSKSEKESLAMVNYKIGNGESTFLWFDPWHPIGSIYQHKGESIIRESGLGRDAKVCSIINNGDWDWTTTSGDIMELLRGISPYMKPFLS